MVLDGTKNTNFSQDARDHFIVDDHFSQVCKGQIPNDEMLPKMKEVLVVLLPNSVEI